MAVSYKYAGEAIALLGVAYGLIKWVGRSLRSLASDAPLEANRIEAMSASTPGAAADMLMRRGIISAEQLSGMTARERDFLLATATPHLAARGSRPTPPFAGPAMSRPPSPVASAATRGAPPAARLHLITPSRPPLGVAVHCPGCGAPLDREALQRVGVTTCERCRRPVSAHIQRARLTVIVDATPDEVEHRRRVDGDG